METVSAESQNQKEPDAWGTSVDQLENGNEGVENYPTNNSNSAPVIENHSTPAESEGHFDQQNGGYTEYEMKYEKSSDEFTDQNVNGESENNYDQVSYMSRLARDRAEKRRSEEEARMNEQRERAAQRLKELEKRMGESSKPTRTLFDPNEPRNSNGTTRTLFDPNEPKNENGRTLYDPNEPREDNRTRTLFDPNANEPRKEAPKRTLYDPSQPYSVMVGEIKEEKSRARSDSHVSSNDEAADSAPVIQLSSYDDRDRGERGRVNTAPRMLYDPKSGSMVAVSPEKGKRGKQKGRKDGGETPQNGKKKGKGRKEENGKNKDSPKGAKGKHNKSRPSENRLPRTCGALYLRDENGKCYSADGQEGDQGYGCHSVPGGKMRNPTAYEKYLEQQRQMQEQQQEEDYDFGANDDEVYLHGIMPTTPAEERDIDLVKADDKIELLTGAPESPTLQATAKAWAPSQIALAAAAEKVKSEPVPGESVSVDGDEEVVKSVTDDDDVVEDDDMDDPVSQFDIFYLLLMQ